MILFFPTISHCSTFRTELKWTEILSCLHLLLPLDVLQFANCNTLKINCLIALHFLLYFSEHIFSVFFFVLFVPIAYSLFTHYIAVIKVDSFIHTMNECLSRFTGSIQYNISTHSLCRLAFTAEYTVPRFADCNLIYVLLRSHHVCII